MNFTSNNLVKNDEIIRKRKFNNAKRKEEIRKEIEEAFLSKLAFKSVGNKRFFIKLIVNEYFPAYSNITEEQVTFILVEYLNKYLKFNSNNSLGLEQIKFDIGLILKVKNGIKKVETSYRKKDKIDYYTMDSPYDELYNELLKKEFSNCYFKFN